MRRMLLQASRASAGTPLHARPLVVRHRIVPAANAPLVAVARPASTSARESSRKRKEGEGSEGKLSPLLLAIKKIEHSHGKGSLMRFGDKGCQLPKVEVISTGSMALDHALGTDGLPRGRIVEMYGPESSGKTTVALHAMAEAQKLGGTCVFIDAEHALDPAYARRIGVDVDNLYISQPDNGEQALDIAETLIKSGKVDCVVIDSVAALVPKAELEGEMGDHHIALQARLMSQALRKLTAVLSRTNCLLIFINQTRQKVGVVFGSNEVTTGGTALRFYSSVRLEIRRTNQLKSEGEAYGNRVRVKVVKNKLAPPFGVAEMDMLFGTGLDKRGEMVDLGVKSGVIKKAGSWFTVAMKDGEPVPFPAEGSALPQGAETVMLGQGREKENPSVAAALEHAIRDQLHQCEEDSLTGESPGSPPQVQVPTELEELLEGEPSSR